MIKEFLKWLREKLPKREVTKEVREKIKVKYPGYHLAKNGSGRRKKVYENKYFEITREKEESEGCQ